MANFKIYAEKLKALEGGFSNDPDDNGGATKCGITIARFREEFGQDKTVDDLRAMTEDQWERITKGGYWDKVGGDEIKNQSIAEIIADWTFNSGLSVIRKVQGIVGAKADGIVGPKTMALINAKDPRWLHYSIKSARANFYADIVHNKASQVKFYEGWMNRLAKFQFKTDYQQRMG